MSILSRILRRSFCTSQASASKAKDVLLNPLIGKKLSLRQKVNALKEPSQHYVFCDNKGQFSGFVLRLAAAKRFDWIEELLEAKKKHDDITRESYTVGIITLYGRAGMFEQASKVFDEMPQLKCERTVCSLNALLGACVNSNKFDAEAEKYFKDLSSEMSVAPNIFSYNIMIKGYGELGSLDLALLLLDEMEKKGIAPNLITYNTLLHCLYVNGRFLDGDNIWSRMLAANIVPDVQSYSAKLVGLGAQKRMSEAVSLFEELASKGIEANRFTYINLIRGFCKAGDLEEGMKWFEKMKACKFNPDRVTIKKLISLACRNGNLDLSLKLCKKIVENRWVVNRGLFELVLDGLVKESRTDEAKQLVELVNSVDSYNYKLNMPSSE